MGVPQERLDSHSNGLARSEQLLCARFLDRALVFELRMVRGESGEGAGSWSSSFEPVNRFNSSQHLKARWEAAAMRQRAGPALKKRLGRLVERVRGAPDI